MTWTWKFTKAGSNGKRVRTKYDRTEFASAGDAETWLGENWREAVKSGAGYAELMEGGTAVATYSLPEES